jgi:hypothetical protein
MRALPLALACSLLPTLVLAEAAPLDCVILARCTFGEDCEETEEEFLLEPTPTGYSASIDGDWVELAQVSPEESEVRSFLLSTATSITVLLSLYPDGAMALTTHEDIGGRHVETGYGRCVEEI